MFPRGKVDLLYRILCMLAYVSVIIFINSNTTLFIVILAFFLFTITERRFENYFLYGITALAFIISFTLGNYILLRIAVVIDYIYYFLSVETLDDEIMEVKRDQYYVRFDTKRKERIKKQDNNVLCTLFVTVHLVLLLLTVLVG